MDYVNMTQEEFLQVKPPETPQGFEDFWRRNYELATAQTPVWHIEREVWSPLPGARSYVVRAKEWDNCEIAMWITRPKKSIGGILMGQGYGNPSTPPDFENYTICLPCIRGLGLSQCKNIPWTTPQHVLHGIASRETYILRGAASDLWTAAGVMTEMFPDTAENLCYTGASMGGGMGALMLPWDNRFRAAFLQVPTFGGNPQRLQVPGRGSGEAVRLYVQDHPEAMEVLCWFDAAISAKFLRIPTIVLPALKDEVVVSVGQFAVANAIFSANKFQYILDKGHAEPTERDREVWKEAGKKRLELFSAHNPAK